MHYNDLYYNKTVNSIIKQKNPVQLQLQILNNNIIDGFILNDDEVNEAYILKLIKNINNPSLREYWIKRLNKTLLDPQDYLNITEARNILEEVTTITSSTELERIKKNLDYTEAVLNKADLDILKYETLIKELPKTTSRVTVMQDAIKDNKLPVVGRNEELTAWLERGSNYKGHHYSYKELDTFSKDIERYNINRFEQEQAMMQNRESVRIGGEPIYASKTWLWSRLEKTRHSGMDNTTIPIHEKFVVVNEKTDDIDYLMFAGDYVNATHASNVVGCKCSINYNTI